MASNIHIINLQIICEVLIAEHMFAHTLKKRESWIIRMAVSIILSVLAAYLFPIQEKHIVLYGTFMYFCLYLCSALSIFFCYEESVWGVIFCSTCGYTMHQLASAANDALKTLCSIFLPSLPQVVIYLLTLVLVYVICYWIFSEAIRKNDTIHINNKKMLLLTLAALVIDILAGLVLMVLELDNMQFSYIIFLQCYNMVACIFILIVEFGLLSNKRLELELDIAQQMMREQHKQYLISKDNIEQINLKCHDLKHQLRTVRKGMAAMDQKALKEIENAIGIYDSVQHTGCAPLDIILTEKSLACEKAGIQLTCMAQGELLSFMEAGDIYSLFGNALDNAIEAMYHMDAPDLKIINLNIQKKAQMVSINVQNYYSDDILFVDGIPKTSKEDKKNHGFGIRSMQLITEKYNGFMDASAENHIFQLNFVFPLIENKA